nr:Peptide G protein-coupled receptor [Hymenolepis microstoma]
MASTDFIPTVQNSTNATDLPDYCEPLYVSGFLHILVTHVSLSIAIFGIPANILALIVLNYRVSNRNPTQVLLTALAIEDILIIIFYSIYYIAIHYFESDNIEWLGNLRYVDTPLFYLVNSTKMIEIYTVVLLSLERYVAIRWPLKAARLCSVGRTKRGLRIIVVLSGIFKLPNFIFDYRVLRWNNACETYRLEPVFGSESWYPTFKLAYVQILDQVCSFVIPLSLLIFLNFGLILRIRRYTKRHTHGHWVGANETCLDNSTYSNMYYSDASPNTFSSIAYGDKTVLTRSLPFQTSFRFRRTHAEKHSLSSEQDETMSRTNHCTEGVFLTSITSESRQRTMNSKNQGILFTLVGVVTVFIICETPTTVCFLFEMATLIYKLYQGDFNETTSTKSSVLLVTSDNLYYYAYPVALLLVLVGCSSNFFIYMLFVIMAHKICCCKDRTKNAKDYGLIRPLKLLRRNKAKKNHPPRPLGHPMRIKADKVVLNLNS